MDVGNEISHKIRSAIKAKLVELGAYVDEELPDYIMVMVANKKSQLQMSEDLGLFLGTNTDKFTTWLHSLLQKLQSITSEPTIGKPDKSDKSKSKDYFAENKPTLSSLCETTTSSSSKSKKRLDSDENKSKKRLSSDDISDSRKEGRKRSEGEKKSSLSEEPVRTENELQNKEQAEGTIIMLSNTNEPETHSSHITTRPVQFPVEKETTPEENNLPASDSESEFQVNAECTVTEETGVTLKTSKETNIVKGTEPVQQTTVDNDVQVIVDDDLSAELLLTENDELTEELEQEPAVLIISKKKSESNRTAVIRINDDKDDTSKTTARGAASLIMSRSLAVDTSRSPPRSSRPRAVASPIRQSYRSTLLRAVEPRPVEMFTRRRRAPVSVIGSVSLDSDDEQGYDPRNPAVGSVASVIRVTARKSSVPPKLQANKTLLLKAMTEAEKSVETQRRVAITPIRPFMRSDSRSRENERDRMRERDRDHERSSRSKMNSSAAARDSQGSGSLRLAQTSLRQAINQSGSNRSDAPVYIPTRKVQPTQIYSGRIREQVGIVSKSKMEAEKQRAWLDEDEDNVPARKCIKLEKDSDSIVNFVIEAEVGDKEVEVTAVSPPKMVPIKLERLSADNKSANVVDMGTMRTLKKSTSGSDKDCRVVEYEQEIVPSTVLIADDEKQSDSGSQGVPVLLEDMDQDEFALDQDVVEMTETASGLLGNDLRHTMGKEPKSKDKTRFVVTLDGVDFDQYQMEMLEAGEASVRFGDEMMVSGDSPAMNLAPVSRSASQQSISQTKDAPVMRSPPKIQPLNISLKDSDEEDDEMETDEVTPLKQAKMMERCKFWPACVNGVACEYHHPTVHCKTFPMCKFGDKCLYIHPNCRFDSKCTRPDCPYTHSSRRSVPISFAAPQVIYQAPPRRPSAPARVSPIQCRFFPSCSNLNCPFFHPKPCRFGLACKSKESGCPFYHPSLPGKDKLTWAAPSKGATASTANAAVTASVKKSQ